MNSHVVFKGSFSVETFPTLLAVERFLSSMNSHVVIEVLFMFKTFSTLITCVRFLSSVNSHVVFKGSFSVETFPALLAGEITSICCLLSSFWFSLFNMRATK